MKRFAIIFAVFAMSLFAFNVEEASAQYRGGFGGFNRGFGGSGISISVGRGFNSGFNSFNRGFGGGGFGGFGGYSAPIYRRPVYSYGRSYYGGGFNRGFGGGGFYGGGCGY